MVILEKFEKALAVVVVFGLLLPSFFILSLLLWGVLLNFLGEVFL